MGVIDLRKRLERIEATRTTGDPTRIMASRCLADGEAAEALANWRAWVADGRASVSGDVLHIRAAVLTAKEWQDRYATPD